jgi:hypothetical protein
MSNNGSLAFSKIFKINEKTEAGFIAPLVESGHLFINGIHASCYADINSQFLANIALKPLIYWYKLSKFIDSKQTEFDKFYTESYLNPYIAILEYFNVKKLVNIFI